MSRSALIFLIPWLDVGLGAAGRLRHQHEEVLRGRDVERQQRDLALQPCGSHRPSDQHVGGGYLGLGVRLRVVLDDRGDQVARDADVVGIAGDGEHVLEVGHDRRVELRVQALLLARRVRQLVRPVDVDIRLRARGDELAVVAERRADDVVELDPGCLQAARARSCRGRATRACRRTRRTRLRRRPARTPHRAPGPGDTWRRCPGNAGGRQRSWSLPLDDDSWAFARRPARRVASRACVAHDVRRFPPGRSRRRVGEEPAQDPLDIRRPMLERDAVVVRLLDRL